MRWALATNISVGSVHVLTYVLMRTHVCCVSGRPAVNVRYLS